MDNKLLIILSHLDYQLVEYSKDFSSQLMGVCHLNRNQIDLYHGTISDAGFNVNYILAHELIHASGKKLERCFKRSSFSYEESIAELGAFLLLRSLNINVSNCYAETSYYIKAMGHYHNNKFVSVYFDAEKAVKYLMELYEN